MVVFNKQVVIFQLIKGVASISITRLLVLVDVRFTRLVVNSKILVAICYYSVLIPLILDFLSI